MTTPRQAHAPDSSDELDRQAAVKRVQQAVHRRQSAEADEALAVRVALAAGASLRELAEVSDRNKDTIARLGRSAEA
jgi:hypothetical protein